ncbi:MAG: signal peptidase I [Candidatus Omnitrophica bacterium]|nr:signal peptidase I [Candidatus Omnitrophota bacterium]
MRRKRKKMAKRAQQPKKKVWREWGESIIVAVALAVFLRTFFFQIYKIPTTSMVPTLRPGDKIFVSKLVYGPLIPFTDIRLPGVREPRRGEVVVFVPPHDPHKAYVKRLIGIGGDLVEIKKGNVYINEEMVVDPRIAKYNYSTTGDFVEAGKPLRVPEGKYFFLGDNSPASLDSRFWGFVDEEDVVGKAIFVWWPPGRMGMIE